MNDEFVLETMIPKVDIIKKITELSGRQGLTLSSPLAGVVSKEKFKLSRNKFLVHPFVPVASGRVEDVGGYTVVKLRFCFPWLGHTAMLLLIVVILNIPFSPVLLWALLLVIAFLWGGLLYRYKVEKKGFLMFFREQLRSAEYGVSANKEPE